MSAPSSSTAPPVGLISRTSERSRVDLPHPFGPMITVKLPSGTRTSRSEMICRSPYPVDSDRARSLAATPC